MTFYISEAGSGGKFYWITVCDVFKIDDVLGKYLEMWNFKCINRFAKRPYLIRPYNVERQRNLSIKDNVSLSGFNECEN